MNKLLTLMKLAIIMCLPCASFAAGEAVTLDSVEGLHASDTVFADTPIVFHIRMTFGNDTYWGISNAFRVYSADSVDWNTTVGACTGAITDSMLPEHRVVRRGITGTGADTVGFAWFLITEGNGIPPYFDSTTCTISIGPIAAEHAGGTVCLDSCYSPPSTAWMWVSSNVLADFYTPSWDGPHCFTIIEPPSCCQLRGDIDHNGTGPDISDFVYLTTYMFQGGPPPPCMEEADVDDSGGVPNIADRMYLWSYMFGDPQGPPPVPCP